MFDLVRQSLALLDRPTRRRVLLACSASVLLALLEAVGIGLVLPFIQSIATPEVLEQTRLFRLLYNLVGSGSTASFIPTLGIAIFGIFLLKSVLGIVFTWWYLGFLSRSEARMATALLRGYMAAPYAMHLRRNSAELIRNVQVGVGIFYAAVVLAGLTLVADVVVMLAIVAVLFLQEPGMASVAAVLGAVVGAGYLFAVRRRSTVVGQRNQHYSVEALRHIHQSLGGIKEARVLGREAHFVAAFESTRLEAADVRRQQGFLQHLPRYYLEGSMVLSVMVLSILLLKNRSGTAALGVLGLFVAAGFRLLASLGRVLTSANQMTVAGAATRELIADFAEFRGHEQARATSAGPPVTFSRELTVDDVSFGYESGSRAVLENVTMRVASGDSVGLVGPSGSGKTTLVDVLLGLLPPTSGRVCADGRDVHRDAAGWQRIVGYVPQSIYLIDDTLRRNVAFGYEDAAIDEERVVEAVRLAQLDKYSGGLADGLETVVGERGVRLSGGQRQRVGIARALYARPRLLILDEATSSLDSETEARIAETIDGLRGRMTLIIIAHRLSTVRACDRLILLEEGRVTAAGTFEQLNETNESFAELVRLSQLGGEKVPPAS